MFTSHQSTFHQTGLMNIGIQLKLMTTGLFTWDPKVHGMKTLKHTIGNNLLCILMLDFHHAMPLLCLGLRSMLMCSAHTAGLQTSVAGRSGCFILRVRKTFYETLMVTSHMMSHQLNFKIEAISHSLKKHANLLKLFKRQEKSFLCQVAGTIKFIIWWELASWAGAN